MNITKDEIADIRGGYPTRCDWCEKEVSPHKLEPEEGGQWVCHDCIDKWEQENKAHWATGQPWKEKGTT